MAVALFLALGTVSEAASVTISAAGAIGPLRMGASTASDVAVFAGQPQVSTVERTESGQAYDTLGYDCGTGLHPLLATTAAYAADSCATVYDIDPAVGTLVYFATTQRYFRDSHGVRIGMRTARADRLAHRKAIGGCLDVLALRTPSAVLMAFIRGGDVRTPSRANGSLEVHGGRVSAFLIESIPDSLGIFNC
jgi:hypothetical protein